MGATLKLIAPVCLAAGLALAQDAASQGTAPSKTTEQVYKNIQVLKGLPAPQLEAAMALMTGALGVRCGHCHSNSFERDDKPAKQTARRMIQMVFELNQGRFDGRDAVTCYTCHRGEPKPAAVLALGRNLWEPTRAGAAQSEATLPTADQVLHNHLQAVGGAAALARITARVAKGSRVGADGVLVPEEVYQKAPNKLLIVTKYPEVVFQVGFDGGHGWARDSRGGSGAQIPDEQLAQLERDAELYGDIKLKELYPQIMFEGKADVGGREAYVLAAVSRKGRAEKLYFDARTGLLIRRYREFKTALGQFPTQTDYEDYREVDGVKLPFTTRWSMPGRVWGRRITEVKHNVPLEDSLFTPPGG